MKRLSIHFLSIVIVLMLCVPMANAQQDPMFTHYKFNTLAVNPGYAGSREALTVTGIAREQWVGIDGRPRTQTITLHTPIDRHHIAIGASIINDEVGPQKTTSAYADFAYRIQVGNEGKLALGIKAGVNLMTAGLANLDHVNPNDVSFQQNSRSDLLPNFGFGAYYYMPRFYAGVSAPKLLENDLTTGVSSKERRHFFIISGTVLEVNNDIDFRPTFLLKMVDGAPLGLDLTASFIFYDVFSAGVMYRLRDAVGLLIGYQFNEQLRAGYSYDYTLTELQNYNSGSHEIMVSYDFLFGDRKKLKSPRYF